MAQKESAMPVYQFVCQKHGKFEEITIRALWDLIKCPKCGIKPKICERMTVAPNEALKPR